MLQNYNKILTKHTVFSIILDQTRSRPPQRKSAYFAHPDFSAVKIEKSAQITQENTIYQLLFSSRKCNQ
jgi:hypothetical protein